MPGYLWKWSVDCFGAETERCACCYGQELGGGGSFERCCGEWEEVGDAEEVRKMLLKRMAKRGGEE